jgi:hypothetical protein
VIGGEEAEKPLRRFLIRQKHGGQPGGQACQRAGLFEWNDFHVSLLSCYPYNFREQNIEIRREIDLLCGWQCLALPYRDMQMCVGNFARAAFKMLHRVLEGLSSTGVIVGDLFERGVPEAPGESPYV